MVNLSSKPESNLKISEERKKKESLDRIVNQYHQAKTDGNTQQIKILEAVLKRLGYTKFKS